MKPEIYSIPQLPQAWVVRASDGDWIVDACMVGWRQRSRYRGIPLDQHPRAERAPDYMHYPCSLALYGIPLDA